MRTKEFQRGNSVLFLGAMLVRKVSILERAAIVVLCEVLI